MKEPARAVNTCKEKNLMNKYFYEFWENHLNNLDKGQKQMEDMTRWIMQGLSSFKELPRTFGKLCSTDFWPKGTFDHIKAWEMTTEDFQKFFKYYLNLMSLVPKDEHLTLSNKYKELNESVADQKKGINDQKRMTAGYKKEIANQKKLVADLKIEIADHKKITVDQKKEIANQKKLIANQKREITRQKSLVANLKKEIAGQIESIKQLQQEASG